MTNDAQDAVAAEYVLGTLSADEREHAEALLAIDPGFAEAVQMWERRLGELNVMVEAIEPPPQVWQKIRAEIGDVGWTSEIPPSAGEATSPESQTAASAEPVLQEAANAPTLAPSPQEAASAPSPTPVPSDELGQKPAASPEISLTEIPAEPAAAPPLQPATTIGGDADLITLARRASHWRRMTAMASAIAALLAIFIVGALVAPGLGPLHRFASPAQSPAAAARDVQLVAVLQQEPLSPAFLLTVDPQSRTLIVRRVSAAPDPSRSYELWLISSRFPAPRSLGVVGKEEFTERAIPNDFDLDTLSAARYAVSLEPAGGSPSGAPSGPILFTGKMVESVPASAPAAPHT